MSFCQSTRKCSARYTLLVAALIPVFSYAQVNASEEAVPKADIEDVHVIGSMGKFNGIQYFLPQSTTVIRENDIKDTQAKKVDEALQYQSGIQAEPYGTDNKTEWFKIRGFDASVSLDGTTTAPNGFFVWTPEVYGLESIEVVKGADSLLYGASETGGRVNLVSKRPKSSPAGEINLSFGNKDQLGLSGDYSGLLTDDGRVRYRLVGQVRQENGAQDYTKMKHYYFAPSLSWDISDQTSLTLLTSFQKEDGIPTNGFLPGYGSLISTPYGKIGRSTYFGEPDADNLTRTQYSLGYEFKHSFGNGWLISQNYRFNHLDMNLLGVFAYSADNDRTAYRGYSYSDGTSKTHSIDNRISKKWENSWLENTLLVGVDYLKAKTNGQNNGFGMVGGIDLFDPVYGTSVDVVATPYKIDQSQLGFYAQNSMKINKNWVVNMGIRHDKAKNTGYMSGTQTDYNISKNSFSGGLMYTASNGLAPYIRYAQSFNPIAGSDGYGRSYKPYEGEQYEGGLKYAPQWMVGKFSIAYFDLKEKNALISDSSNISVQAGKRQNKGVELQADIRVTDSWSVLANYTHYHSRQDLSSDKTIQTPLTPKNMASAQVKYEFIDGALEGLSLSTGLRYVGSTTDEQYYSGYKVSSYTLWDVMAQYKINQNWQLQLNVRNITDKDYLSGCSFYCYYGAPRTITGRLTYTWN
ncbi:TonB-dependent siderophore receptor [Neisseria sp. Ec49-e6-T10]|uniref:TonB-dependent siderophore receptor n=1 Tax=Neisseria sp. Ec49-e6-T10 TaxID=3140744 RepID=UPI003EBA74B1